jgi:hypothetical protein
VHDRVPPAGTANRTFDQPRTMPRVRRLPPADVEAIAHQVVKLLGDEPRLGQHVDTTALAIMLGVSGDWVREHAAELGAIRIGNGPKGALRFELRRVRTALEQRRLVDSAPRAFADPDRPGASQESNCSRCPTTPDAVAR